MRVSVVACLAVAVVACALVVAASDDVIDASNVEAVFAAKYLRHEWHQFKRTHNKHYASAELEQHRFEIFSANMATAAELQAKNPSAVFGVTPFSDLHPLEFKRTHLNFRPAVGDSALYRKHAGLNVAEPTALPTNFDWRHPDQNRPVGITAVKDQGQCGSCWAFSATEAVESAWILAGNAPVALAPQQTVDCDTQDSGCNGGDTVTAYQYMEGAGLEAEASYPYTSGQSGNAGTCNYNASAVVAKMTSFAYATPGCTDACTHQDEATLQTNLYNIGPVSICVDASTWQNYVSGILSSASGCSSNYDNLDHCVQLVGYGFDTTLNQKYWTVRNSWAASWGEEGFIRLLYGKNTCGVADEATQVTAA